MPSRMQEALNNLTPLLLDEDEQERVAIERETRTRPTRVRRVTPEPQGPFAISRDDEIVQTIDGEFPAAVDDEVVQPGTQRQPIPLSAIFEKTTGVRADAPEWTRPAFEALSGLNSNIAELIGLPIDAFNLMLEQVGMQVLEDPENAADYIRAGFEAAGIPARSIDTLAGRMGPDLLAAVFAWGGLSLSAGKLAAAEGTSVTSLISREIGLFMQRFPGRAFGTEMGAAFGGHVASEAAQEPGRSGMAQVGMPMAGALAGGMLGFGLTATVDNLTKMAWQAARNLGRELGESVTGRVRVDPNALRTAVVDPTADPLRTHAFADFQLQGQRQKLYDAVHSAIEGVPVRGNLRDAQAAFQRRLRGAELVGDNMVNEAWGRVDKGIRVGTQRIVTTVTDQQKRFRDTNPGAIDEALNERMLSLMTKRDKKGRVTALKAPTMGELIDMRSGILQSIRAERGNAAPNSTLIRNLHELQSMIAASMRDAAQTSDPNQLAMLDQALAMTREMADVFYRGPVGELLGHVRTGAPKVDPGRTVEALLTKFRGTRAVGEAAERTRQSQLVPEMENAVNLIFRDHVMSSRPGLTDPQELRAQASAAEQFIRRNRGSIEEASRAGAQLKAVTERLWRLSNRSAEIENSELARWSNMDPEKGIASLFVGPNPARRARDIMETIGPSSDAVGGLQRGVVQYLLRTNNFSGTRMGEAMRRPEIDRMMREILSPEQMQRLHKMVGEASQIEKGDTTVLQKIFRTGGRLSAGIFGAQVGRQIAQHTSGGTVQTPGIVATAMRSLYERTLRVIPPEELLARAVFDPQWERFLSSQVPSSPAEMAALVQRMRRLIAGLEGARQIIAPHTTETEDE
jgi:hypothetical protein